MMTGLTDQQLVRDYVEAAGHPSADAAFAELVRRHADWMHSAALRRVRDPALAHDVTQATFIVLAKKARSLRADAALEPWLFKVLSYTASAALRSERRRRKHEQEAAAVR